MLFAYIYVFLYPSLWYIYYLTDISYVTHKFSPYCLWYSHSVCVLICVLLFAIPWTVARQAPLFVGLPRQEYRIGLLCLLPGDLLNSGTEPRSPTLQADSLPSEPSRKPKNTGVGSLSLL